LPVKSQNSSFKLQNDYQNLLKKFNACLIKNLGCTGFSFPKLGQRLIGPDWYWQQAVADFLLRNIFTNKKKHEKYAFIGTVGWKSLFAHCN